MTTINKPYDNEEILSTPPPPPKQQLSPITTNLCHQTALSLYTFSLDNHAADGSGGSFGLLSLHFLLLTDFGVSRRSLAVQN